MKKQACIRLESSRHPAGGFTLIEVMIVVAVIGVLAAIALPSYNDYVRRGQIPEAFTLLSEYRAKMEQYYQDSRNYGTAAKCATDASASSWNTFPRTAQFFSVDCATTNAQQGYTVTATGIAGKAIGHVYTINQNGDRATTKFKGNDVTAACWLTKTSTC
ncbi:type IV pilin protein [Variovorax sp. J22R24]|uniref:type IV pilin protein n=1 Tax=Variovorax gracilis TaxID=3053502 RepID=UPI0025788598|nr:type IV pilin protein [Variovorax sp. J22R24]MDM0106033.1 type IV pilin protein [Variovorax sp. J22R24]